MNEHTQLSLTSRETAPLSVAEDSTPPVRAAAGAQAPDAACMGLWFHAPSGMWLPRGTVVTTRPDPEDWDTVALIRAEVESESARRCVVADMLQSRKVKRSARDESQLHAFCSWLSGKGMDIIGTVTFTDEYAARHGIYSLPRALDDVWRGLTEMEMKKGKIRGFRNRFILSGEWHPSGRTVPHVHLALESKGAPMQSVCNDLWRYFYGTRGRSRFEPMRDCSEATLYGLKDTIKASDKDPDCIRLRLVRPKRQGKR